jgi:hypothetical protein
LRNKLKIQRTAEELLNTDLTTTKASLRRSLEKPRGERNFYDLASALGEGILASDPTAGPYSGLARGFAQFNKDSGKAADEARNIQQQIALKLLKWLGKMKRWLLNTCKRLRLS